MKYSGTTFWEKMMMRFVNMMLCVSCLMMAVPAAADEEEAPSLPPGFVALSAAKTSVHGKQPIPVAKKTTPQFIAIGPHNFKATLPASHSSEAAVVKAQPEKMPEVVLPEKADVEKAEPKDAQNITFDNALPEPVIHETIAAIEPVDDVTFDTPRLRRASATMLPAEQAKQIISLFGQGR